MRRSHFALALLVALLVLVLPQAASAKGGASVIRVAAESGKVGVIRGASARAFLIDLDNAHRGSCPCGSADAAAKFVHRLMARQRWKTYEDGGWPRGILLIQWGHSGPWLYYPASRTTPPYMVAPAGIGTARLTWDSWRVVTARMQRIITAALKQGTVSTYTGSGSSAFPTGWAVGGGVAGLLLAGLILDVWRRPGLFARRHRLTA